MVSPLSEDAARELLRRDESEAANPDYFAGTRRTNGWSFAWRHDLGDAPVGSLRWIVADNGRSRALEPRERADDGIAEELSK
jgi:hypothetical protein